MSIQEKIAELTYKLKVARQEQSKELDAKWNSYIERNKASMVELQRKRGIL